MTMTLKELTKLVDAALMRYGYSKEEIPVIREILLYAQLRGNNQGVVKLIGRGLPKNNAAGTIETVRETKISALINGNCNSGMIVMKKAMHIALDKAAAHGFGMVGTHNTNSSTGAIGYYANEIAKRGYIGFVFAGSPETVSTYGSYEPIFGTNPLAIGVPTETEPIVLDMATAAMAYYGLIEAKTAGKKIAPDIAYDANGALTTDPAKAMDGALRPFDKGYKSAGLALIVEVLTGPLVGASFTGIGNTATNWGNLIFVFDPSLLADPAVFRRQVSALGKRVKATKKLPGVKEIFLPGERGNALARSRAMSGGLDIEDNLIAELKKVAGQ